ncbi:SDR family oxidoreductase [Luteococcus sp.]|uniref:SDR family oxidoreductase n=1 Tax=Luteococcus sp. TaxID=1969402 RepID=UPI003735340F
MSQITIIGGHGKVALLAAPLLVEAGHTVRGLIRNPEQAEDVAATGAEPVVADVEQLGTEELAELFNDTDVLVWSAGAGGGSPERTRAVDQDAAIRSMDAAQQAGVGHYVMVSYFGASKDHGISPDNSFFAYAEAKAAADEHLRGSELAWTILMPSTLTLDEPTGTIELGAAEAGQVSRANVAAVLAETVRRGTGLAGRELPFNDGSTPIEDALA